MVPGRGTRQSAGTRSAWWQAVRVPSTSRSGGRSADADVGGQRAARHERAAGRRRLGGTGGADAERLAGGPAGGLLGRPRHRRRGGQRDRVRVPGLRS